MWDLPELRIDDRFPTSELTTHPLSPLTAPTDIFGGIEHGTVRGSSVVTSGA